MKKALVAVVVVLAMMGAIVLLVLSTTMLGVGATDLEIRFVITDAHTGQPIPGAIVHVWVDGIDQPEKEHRLTTDDAGTATYKHGECWFTSRSGPLQPTRIVYNLSWGRFEAEAQGYIPSAARLHEARYEVAHTLSSRDGVFTRLQFLIPLAPKEAK